MSLIVAARFDTFADAENAGRRLFAGGYAEDDVSIFFVNPAGQHARYPMGGDQASDPASRKVHLGALVGAAVVGALGALVGAGIWLYAGWSPWVLVLAVAVGAYVGSLGGGLIATRTAAQPRVPGNSTGIRLAGVLLSVHVTAATEADVAQILKSAGGMDVEKANGRWQDGNWVDFDPVAPPVLSEKVSARDAGSADRA